MKSKLRKMSYANPIQTQASGEASGLFPTPGEADKAITVIRTNGFGPDGAFSR